MKQELGNALFLILIAVALFAMLSYAITQSGKGSGSIDKEQKIITASIMVQQSGAVQSTVMRMMLTGTTAITLDLGNPSPPAFPGFESLPCTTGENCVFSSDGGNAKWPDIPKGEASIRWEVLSQGSGFSVKNVGTTAEDFLLDIYDLSQKICEQINKGLGLSVPVTQEPNGDAVLEAYSGSFSFCYQYPVAWGPGYDFITVLYAQ